MASRKSDSSDVPPLVDDEATIVEVQRENNPPPLPERMEENTSFVDPERARRLAKESVRDRYENSQPPTPAAPQAHETFVPGLASTKEELLAQLEASLKVALGLAKRGPFPRARAALFKDWMPIVKHALLQSGGDGLDARLDQMVNPPGRRARSPLLWNLCEAMESLGRARDSQALLAEARKAAVVVMQAFVKPNREPLSMRYLNEELEGRVPLDALLKIFFSSAQELQSRRDQITTTIDSMRGQLREVTSVSSADGLVKPFHTLKIERGLIEAELRLRSSPRR